MSSLLASPTDGPTVHLCGELSSALCRADKLTLHLLVIAWNVPMTTADHGTDHWSVCPRQLHSKDELWWCCRLCRNDNKRMKCWNNENAICATWLLLKKTRKSRCCSIQKMSVLLKLLEKKIWEQTDYRVTRTSHAKRSDVVPTLYSSLITTRQTSLLNSVPPLCCMERLQLTPYIWTCHQLFQYILSTQSSVVRFNAERDCRNLIIADIVTLCNVPMQLLYLRIDQVYLPAIKTQIRFKKF